MCSHYQAEKRRAFYEKRWGLKLPPEWEPPRGGLHIYPTQFAPIIRRPPERESGDEAVPDVEVIEARFGLLPGFATEVKYGTRRRPRSHCSSGRACSPIARVGRRR